MEKTRKKLGFDPNTGRLYDPPTPGASRLPPGVRLVKADYLGELRNDREKKITVIKTDWFTLDEVNKRLSVYRVHESAGYWETEIKDEKKPVEWQEVNVGAWDSGGKVFYEKKDNRRGETTIQASTWWLKDDARRGNFRSSVSLAALDQKLKKIG